MRIGISDQDQTKIKDAFSTLGTVCGNMWDQLFDDKSEEEIQELKKQIWNLEEQVQVLSNKRKKLEKHK
jgi:flagellar motility protein MotE (MotC chaperone)